MANWRKGSDPREIVRRIERSKTRSGVASAFSYFDHSEHLVLLGGMVEMNAAIPETEKRNILNRSTFDTASQGAITATGLLRNITTHEAAYLRQPLTKFRLLTGISLAITLALPHFRIQSANISFGSKLTNRERRARENLLDQARHSVAADLPTNYLPSPFLSPLDRRMKPDHLPWIR